MDRIKIDLLSIREVIETREKKRRKTLIFAKAAVFCGVFLMLVGGIFSVGVLFSSDSGEGGWRRLPLLSQIQRLARSADKGVMGEAEDRINVLLLGMGGASHEAGGLTDTIMVASLKPSTSEVSLMSIPRDMVVPIPNRGWRKVNAVNAFAEKEAPGQGARVAAEAIGRIVLGAPIHYYVRVDFDAFEDFIDDLGGVEVCVERTFDDYSYPIRGQEDNEDYYARFEHLHVEEGCQEMDGSFALKYVRSRHAAWPEGSDFARSRRQQLVIQAVKNELLSASTLLNPKRLGDLYTNFKKHVSTNVEIWEAIRFAKMASGIERNAIVHKVLDDSPDGLLYSAISSQGAYILQPRAGDFSEIQSSFANIFDGGSATASRTTFSIEIQNGTKIPGLASTSAMEVEKLGYTVSAISNAEHQDYAKTVIYDLSGGRAADVIAGLREHLNANVSEVLPEWLRESGRLLPESSRQELEEAPAHQETTDVLIVLGEEAALIWQSE